MRSAHEKALLGALIQDSSILDRVTVGEELFLDAKARQLFAVVRDLHGSGQPANLISVADAIEGKDICTPAELAGLTDMPTAANAEYYIGLLKERAMVARIRRLSADIGEWVKGRRIDCRQVLERIEREVLEIEKRSDDDRTVDAQQAAHQVVEHAEKRYAEAREGPSGVISGFSALDDLTGGFQDGEMILLGARTNVGKTALAVSMIERQVSREIPVAMATLEMSTLQVWNRLVAINSMISTSRLRNGRLGQNEFGAIMEAAGQLSTHWLRMIDSTEMSVNGFRAWATRMVGDGARIVYLDYVGLLDIGENHVPRWEKMASVSRTLKATARKLRVPLVCLVQLDRSAAGKKNPGMANIRDTGALEQDADVILILRRQDKADSQEDSVPATLVVDKQRNGPTGKVELLFRKSLTHFREARDI